MQISWQDGLYGTDPDTGQADKQWRLILQKDTSAAYGLAVDETTSLSVARNNSAPILHLYNFLPCVVLGRYQSADEAIDVEACRKYGLEINRRHTGGGTVLMGPKALALGFSIPKDYRGVGPSINDVFNNLGGILCKALGKYGVKARFRPKNDIEIKGKKIAGLSASLEERDVAFFHTSLLLDFDFKMMMKVFRLPIKKLSDKHISCFTQRMTTLRAERGRKTDLPSFQSIVRKAFEDHFGITFRIDTLNQWEIDQLDTLLRHRYTNPDWIFSRRHPKVGMGYASKKTPGGLIEVGIILSGEVIEAAYLTGDFLSTSVEINKIEACLRYCAATAKAINERLKPVIESGTIFKVRRDIIASLVLKAAKEARVARQKALEEAERRREAEEERQRLEAEAMRAALKIKPPDEAKEITEEAPTEKPAAQVQKTPRAAKRKALTRAKEAPGGKKKAGKTTAKGSDRKGKPTPRRKTKAGTAETARKETRKAAKKAAGKAKAPAGRAVSSVKRKAKKEQKTPARRQVVAVSSKTAKKKPKKTRTEAAKKSDAGSKAKRRPKTRKDHKPARGSRKKTVARKDVRKTKGRKK
jgi:lipoate-protein ligase A